MANQSILRISRVRAALLGSRQHVVNTESRRSSSYRAVLICVSAGYLIAAVDKRVTLLAWASVNLSSSCDIL